MLGSRKLRFECWKWIAGCDSLWREKSEERPRMGEEGGGAGGAVEMRVAAPFFTGDKNICWDINLEL